jgi:hypothetical protein
MPHNRGPGGIGPLQVGTRRQASATTSAAAATTTVFRPLRAVFRPLRAVFHCLSCFPSCLSLISALVLLCAVQHAAMDRSEYAFSTLHRHILNTAEFNVRISVWSLANSSGITAALRGPKHADRGMDFSRDGRFLAVAERENCKDFVQIYRHHQPLNPKP